jgi:hypothetical protein
MNVASFDKAYDLGSVEELHTYARRIARWLLLKCSCEEGHPILAIEEDLIEMSKARLQEFLLGAFPEDPSIVRQTAIVAVKRVAASRIYAAEVDTEVKQNLLTQLQEMSMDDLIPQVH